jgi:anti-sigma B factor antagonist
MFATSTDPVREGSGLGLPMEERPMERTGEPPSPPPHIGAVRKDVLVQLLEISTRQDGRHALVALRGELDLAAAEELRARLRTACEEARGRIVLELSELEFVDSTGLSILVEYHQETRMAGGRLILVAPRPNVVRVLGITGLDRHLMVCERLDEAIAALDGLAQPRTRPPEPEPSEDAEV